MVSGRVSRSPARNERPVSERAARSGHRAEESGVSRAKMLVFVELDVREMWVWPGLPGRPLAGLAMNQGDGVADTYGFYEESVLVLENFSVERRQTLT